MSITVGPHPPAAEDAGEDPKRVVKARPVGVLSTVLIFLALIAMLLLGIMLLFRH